MLRTGFRDGFLPFEAGKNHAGTGHRGFAGPGMQYHTVLWLRFLNFFHFFNLKRVFWNQPDQPNSHFKVQAIVIYTGISIVACTSRDFEVQNGLKFSFGFWFLFKF